MLPNLQDTLKTAIIERCRLLVIIADGENSRLIEPYLAWESTTDGIVLVGNQVRGHTSRLQKLPALRQFKLRRAVQCLLLSERFELDHSEKYIKLREKVKRKPIAEVRFETPYTELSDVQQGPIPVNYADTTRVFTRGF